MFANILLLISFMIISTSCQFSAWGDGDVVFRDGSYHLKLDRKECMVSSGNTLSFAAGGNICLEQKMTFVVQKKALGDKNFIKAKVDECEVLIAGESKDELCEKYKSIGNINLMYDEKKETFLFSDQTNLYQRNAMKDVISYFIISKKKFVGINGRAFSVGDNRYEKKASSSSNDLDNSISIEIKDNVILANEKKYFNQKLIAQGETVIYVTKTRDIINNTLTDLGLTLEVGFELEKDVEAMKKRQFEARLSGITFDQIKKEIETGLGKINPGQLQAIIEAQVYLYPRTKQYFISVLKKNDIRPLIKKAIERGAKI